MFSLVSLLLRLLKIPMAIILMPITVQRFFVRISCLAMAAVTIAVVAIVIIVITRFAAGTT